MKFIYFIFTLFLFTACDHLSKIPSKQFWMDNPTDQAIQVTVDSVVYDIPASSGIFIDLLAGRHSLAYNGENIKFFVKPNDQGCIINPTLSNYIFFHEIYSVIGKEIEANAEYEKIKNAYLYPFEIQPGDTIDAPFKVINDELFIEQYEYYWHLGVTEPYKNGVRIAMGNSNLSTAPQSKIFRESDFFKYVGRENLPEGFAFEQSNYKLSDIEPFVLVPDTMTMDCEPAQMYLDKYRNQYKNLLRSEPSEYIAIYDSVRVGYYKLFPKEIEEECSPRYNKNSAKTNFDAVNIAIGKKLEKFVAKNAIVIKD